MKSTLINLVSLLILTSVLSCKNDPKNIDDTIHIRLPKDPDRINPLINPNPISREIYQYIHLPLADYDPKSYELTPILLKTIPNEIAIDTGKYKGGIAFDIEIREDAKWDDGSPITAADYEFTIKAINLPSTNAGKYRELTSNISDIILDKSNVKKCRVIFKEDYLLALETAVTVEVYQQSYYDTRNALKNYTLASIVDTTLIKKDTSIARFVADFNGNDYSRSKIRGSGPYSFVKWVTDQTVELKRKEDYWAKNINVANLAQGPEKMIFHIIVDDVTALTQLQNGQLDIMNQVPADKYEEMKKDANLSAKFDFFEPSLTKYYYININHRRPELAELNVRKALNHLIQIDDIIANLENGKGQRLASPIHPIKTTYNHKLKNIPFSIDEAKKLLDSGGWSDTDKDGILDKMIKGNKVSLDLDILISGQELGKRLALMLKDNAAKVGIKINIMEKDFKQIKSENLKTRNYDLVPAVLSGDIQTWDDLTGRWHSASDTPSGSNEISYHNSTLDQMLDQVLTTKDVRARIAKYHEIQQIIYDDCPVIFLYAPKERLVVSKKWQASSSAKRPGYMANTFTASSKLSI
jgi:peptide/nickel transport system substrate-binding protein